MGAHHERGFTLAEALVGLAVGLLVVAAAIAFALAHAREVRALWIQSRVMQDLRDAADLVERDLRRAGHWRGASSPAWSPDAATLNPHAALLPAASASDAARLSYSNDDGPDTDEPIAFRLRDGVIEMLLGSGRWQAVTDAGTVVVTLFSITPVLERIPLQAVCARLCADAAACTPAQSVRSVNIAIRGHAAGDARFERSVQSLVHLRNDIVDGTCPS
jgi:prepilin peptidase dependent protein B